VLLAFHIAPRSGCPCVEEFVLEAEATKGRDLRLNVRRIRSGAARDRPREVVWLDFRAPHRNLVVDVTVPSARMITNIPQIGARVLLPGCLALGAPQGKLDADLRSSTYLVRLRFILSMITILSLLRMGASWRLCSIG
jgi:hypothetical protein